MGKACPKCSSNVEHDFGVFVCAKCGAVLFVDFDGNVQLSNPQDAGEAPAVSEEIPQQAEEVFELDEPESPLSENVYEVAEAPLEIPTEAPAEVSAEAVSEGTPEPVANNVTEVNFQDVADYANQMELDNSPLVYTLWIEGIDRKEVREKVIEVLKDIKFNLHLKDLIPTIKGGILEIKDLNPVKTSLIATRLREESVSFRWKQNVFQSEAASGT